MKRCFFCLLLTLITLLIIHGCNQTGQRMHLNSNARISDSGPQDTVDNGWWESEAREMVERQIESRGISDKKLIGVMQHTPRHRFVPEQYRREAYSDYPLRIGYGQTISQPFIVAAMTHYLDLSGDEKVLEIGTGSGYQAAILSELAREVYTIEIVKPLADTAKKRLQRMGYKNVHVKHGDGYKGWPGQAPFDRIILTAAPEEIPQALVEQLKNGGKLILPEGGDVQVLKLLTKTRKGKIKERIITSVRFVPMVHPNDTIK